jgi:hypothetical protein
LACTATLAEATVTPISGTPIGLEHDPEGIVAHDTTDAKGTVIFAKLKPGRYGALVDTSKLKSAVIIKVWSGSNAVRVFGPIAPGKNGLKIQADDSQEDGVITINVESAPATSQTTGATGTVTTAGLGSATAAGGGGRPGYVGSDSVDR